MSLVKHHSARLKIVEEEYGKLKQKVGERVRAKTGGGAPWTSSAGPKH